MVPKKVPPAPAVVEPTAEVIAPEESAPEVIAPAPAAAPSAPEVIALAPVAPRQRFLTRLSLRTRRRSPSLTRTAVALSS